MILICVYSLLFIAPKMCLKSLQSAPGLSNFGLGRGEGGSAFPANGLSGGPAKDHGSAVCGLVGDGGLGFKPSRDKQSNCGIWRRCNGNIWNRSYRLNR